MLKPGYIVKDMEGTSVHFRVYQAQPYPAVHGCLAVLIAWNVILSASAGTAWVVARVLGFQESWFIFLPLFIWGLWKAVSYGFIPWQQEKRALGEPFHALSADTEKRTLTVDYVPIFPSAKDDLPPPEIITLHVDDIRCLAMRSINNDDHFSPVMKKFPEAHRKSLVKAGDLPLAMRFELDLETADGGIIPLAFRIDKHTARSLSLQLAEALGRKACPMEKRGLWDVQYFELKGLKS